MSAHCAVAAGGGTIRGAAMSGPQPRQLDYAPPLQWHQRRRVRRWILAGLLAMAIASAWWWGPLWWHDIRLRYYRWQCNNYTASADQVVYAEDAKMVEQILQAGGTRCVYPTQFGLTDSRIYRGAVPKIPGCWENLASLDGAQIRSSDAIVFLHERSTPKGVHWLICVTYSGCYENFYGKGRTDWVMTTNVISPRSVPNGTESRGIEANPGTLRLFAGQADPADASHFTFMYELNGQRGTIDGWLQDDQRDKRWAEMNYQIRDGPAKR